MSSCLAKSVHTSQLSLFSDLNFAVLPEVVAWLRVLIQYRAKFCAPFSSLVVT